jgi:hypothetical protein
MVHGLPTPTVLRRYFDDSAGLLIPAFELCWQEGPMQPRERLWELPESVSLVGPPPERFGIKVERMDADAYAVLVLWDRTRLAWDHLTRVQLLTSALTPLLKALGGDLPSALDQPARTRQGQRHKVA